MVKVLNESNFQEEVLDSKEVVVVDFYADWCGPCRMMAPILEGVSEKNISNVKICKVNVDDNNNLAMKYRIMTIPTIIVFKEGNEVHTFNGVVSEAEIINKINEIK